MAVVRHCFAWMQDAMQNRPIHVGAVLCLSVGCATSPALPTSTSTAEASAAQVDMDVRRANRERRDADRAAALSQPENQRRMDRLRGYQIGSLSEAAFWADGWDARDPLIGTLGVIALRTRSAPAPEARYTLGVLSQGDVGIAQNQTGSDLRLFLRTVADDRQALLNATRAGETLDIMQIPLPLRYRVTQGDNGTTWESASNDIPLFAVTFVGGVLARLEDLPVQ